MPSSRQLAHEWSYPRHDKFVEDLKKAAQEWFAHQECKVHEKYGYRLAELSDWGSNIILPEVTEYIVDTRKEREAKKQGFPLHDYVHHGLSSQALLFNLIVPLIVRNDMDLLRDLINSRGIEWPGSNSLAVLEYEDRKVFNEDRGQPTSIDLVIGDPAQSGALFIESKLVETEFGGCSVFNQGDCDGSNPSQNFSRCYLHHIGRLYWSLLKEYHFLDGPLSQGPICLLGIHYQFFREVLFALKKNGYFILLSDSRSPTFYCSGPSGERGLMPLLISFVPEKYRTRIGQISVQDVVQAIKGSARHDWIEQFKLKYGISSS